MSISVNALSFSFLMSLVLTSYGQDEAQIAGHTWYEKVDTGWLAVEKEDFQYDAHHQLIRTVRYNRVGNEWKEKETTVYEYLGDSVRLEFKTETDGTGSVDRDKYVLDHRGNETAVFFQDFDSIGQQWITGVHGQFYQDDKNRIIEKLYLRNKEGQWMPEDRNLFKYDKHDRLKSDEFQMREGDHWIPHQITVNHYDKKGKLQFAEIFPQDQSNPGKLSKDPDTRIEFTYDPGSNSKVKLIHTWKEGKWVPEFKKVTWLTSL